MNERRAARQSGFELLRILAMVIIVAHHFARYSGFEKPEGVTFGLLWTQFLYLGGKLGVNVFVLISGYFLIESRGVRTVKALQLLLQDRKSVV